MFAEETYNLHTGVYTHVRMIPVLQSDESNVSENFSKKVRKGTF